MAEEEGVCEAQRDSQSFSVLENPLMSQGPSGLLNIHSFVRPFIHSFIRSTYTHLMEHPPHTRPCANLWELTVLQSLDRLRATPALTQDPCSGRLWPWCVAGPQAPGGRQSFSNVCVFPDKVAGRAYPPSLGSPMQEAFRVSPKGTRVRDPGSTESGRTQRK